jgi:hypothetical protein
MSTKKNTKTTKNNNPTGATAQNLEFEANVLFQRLYGKWYAFSEVDGECLISEVPDEEVQKRLVTKKAPKLAA